MSGFRLGPFEARDEIASGGMGDIWLGSHVVQGVPVAIKVIRRESADDTDFRTVFRREVRAVAQLDHPSIISLFDIGEVPEETANASDGVLEAGNPYLVMEYLEHGSLDSLKYPLAWPQVRQTLLTVLDGLAHAHANGITHRDLKPGNILLADSSSDSPIRVTDFGLAFSSGKSLPTDAAGTAVGTPFYMSPEQFVADWRNFGPWTDLYALGCLAYQLASGRVPFEDRDVLQLGLAHLQSPPPPLECPPDYPDGFPSWVAKLLEKEPINRFRRCADAAAGLAALSGTDTARGGIAVERHRASFSLPPIDGQPAAAKAVTRGPDWRTPAPTRRPFKLIGAGLRLFGLRAAPIVGRDAERDRMWEALHRVAESGTPGVVMLDGAAGTGKSRLAAWLCERSHEMGLADIMKAEHNRFRGGESSLSQMLAEAWSCLGSSEEELRDRVSEKLSAAGVESRALELAIGEFIAPAALGDSYKPGMFHEFRSRSERFGVLFEALRRVYHERPVVIWLDDVHWGLDALLFTRYMLARADAEPLRLLVVVTARDDVLVESNEATDLVREFSGHDSALYIHVEPLSQTDSRQLVGNLLYLEGDVSEQVSVRSGGNPLYATELVGDWVKRGILKTSQGGFVLAGTEHPEVPDDIHSVWVGKVEGVLDDSVTGAAVTSPEVQRAQARVELELAAALGDRIDENEWQSLCALARVPDPAPLLEALLSARMARINDDGWSFSHSMLSDSIERIARERGRWPWHNKLCADMLEQRRPVPHWGDSERIGRHRFEAGQFEAALAPLLRGARERTRLDEYAGALDLLGLRSRALDEQGRAVDDRQRADGWLLRADISCTRRELGTAKELANRVRATVRAEDLDGLEGAALLILGRVNQLQGRTKEAVAKFKSAEATLRSKGTKEQLAACLSEQAQAMLAAGSLEQAWNAFNEAQELWEETHQLIPWAENQLGLARVALGQGDLALAHTVGQRVRRFADREGLSRVEAAAWLAISEVQIEREQLSEAIDSLDACIGLFDQLGLTAQTFHPRLSKTVALVESGSMDRAQTELQQLRGSPRVDAPVDFRLGLACVELAVGVDGPEEEYRNKLEQVGRMIGKAEVFPPHAVRCLVWANGRAQKAGYPDRSRQIRNMGASNAKRLGDSAIATKFA